MQTTLIKNAQMINEGTCFQGDMKIRGALIDQIATSINAGPADKVIDAKGHWLFPGMIDDQVHFREPGMGEKGSIASESRAAVAGGITSYMEMPNVSPPTTSFRALEQKYAIAQRHSAANYSFYLGATENNLEQIKSLPPRLVCGVKVFMGASTGDLLVEHPSAIDAIFRDSPVLVATHCESTPHIVRNLERYRQAGKTPTIADHPLIRDADACYASSSYAVSTAKRYGTALHVLHITTEKELALFAPGPVAGKAITAEACVHHLWFNQDDYATRGNLIKCNPSIKSSEDQRALLAALDSGQIDIIATDHAPHTWAEKQRDYLAAPAGMPLVQHALLSLFDQAQAGRMSLEQIAEKTAHNPAIRYSIDRRGFLREGYYADLVLIEPEKRTPVTHDSCRYHCEWTPFHGHTFRHRVAGTWVNGQRVYDGEAISDLPFSAQPLLFNR